MINYSINKLKNKIWSTFVSYLRPKSIYHFIYKSYWHYRFYKNNGSSKLVNYYSAIPNVGAGIGHQIANWIAGYWFAKKFDLQFAHSPFSTKTWDTFLGFGLAEVKVSDLLTSGYKKVKLPLFDENNSVELELQKRIIESYATQKIVFIAEQDQSYKDQFGVINKIKSSFFNSPSRLNDLLIYIKENYNIAVHIRRGDIVGAVKNKNSNLSIRWISNDYFSNVLQNVIEKIAVSKPFHIYIFSEGSISDFSEFSRFPNIHFCLDMDAKDSFLHLVYADLLITSKSSFSYKPALLSNGIKVCPDDFWHGYPNDNNWILADDEGKLLQ